MFDSTCQPINKAQGTLKNRKNPVFQPVMDRVAENAT
jgi:hypothetical protein